MCHMADSPTNTLDRDIRALHGAGPLPTAAIADRHVKKSLLHDRGDPEELTVTIEATR